VSLHPRQEGFGAGEISDRLRSRVSLPIYQKALRLARNFLIDAEGNATNRPGFQLDHETKLSGASKSVVRKFIFGGGQNYVLEFGVNYIRFHQDGAMIESSPGVALQVVTTYAEADLPQIKLTQSGDVVYIFCGNKAIKVLTRVAHTNWTFVDFAPTASVNPPTALALLVGATDADAQHVGKSWDILVTSISGGDTPEESLVSNLLNIPNTKALYPDRPAFYTWVAPAAGAAPVRYAVYRATGGSGRYGFIGESNSNVFRDDGQVPLYAEPPPSGRNPFAGGAANNPQTGTFHSQRLWAANSFPAPNTIWSTRLAAFKSFDAASPPKDDDAITLTLATREFDEVRSMLSLVNLLAFGSGAEWILTGVQGAPPTPTGCPAIPVSYWGSSWLDPLIAGDTPLFVTDTDSHVRELVIQGRADGSLENVGNDLSMLALHLFKEHTIVDSCFARSPNWTGFYVRDDGVLLALSYIKQQQQVAWSQHTTDGFFESVCSIPEGVEDAVYAVVRRTVNGVTKRYVERMATRQISSARWGVFSDGSVFFNGENVDPTLTFTVTGIYTVGGVVNIVASAAAFQAGDVGDNIVLMPAEDGGDIRIQITGFTNATHVAGIVLDAVPVALQAVATADWAFGRQDFSGLDHLNGVVVDVIADGVPVDALPAVAGGLYSLASPAVYVVIGRHYDADLGLLDLREERSKEKLVNRVIFEVVDTAIPGIQAGQTLGDLSAWFPLPEVAADPVSLMALDPITGDQQAQVSIQIDSSWNPGGAAYLRQSKPLPITVKAAIREVTIAPD
jgi:hypothetical protein